jgi:hypothetical protein
VIRVTVHELIVDPAYEGPPGAAHGGYVCGLLAGCLPPDAELTLRRPVPVGTALRLESRAGGAALYDTAGVVAEAGRTRLESRTPVPPTFAEALAASAAFPGFTAHPFPRCVVCGPDRTDPHAFRVFPGPVAGRELVAAVWYPGRGAVLDGVIRREFAWAALDCPAGWAAAAFGALTGPAVLGRMAARLQRPVLAGEAHILVAWLAAVSGRKLTAGSALFSRSGVLQAFSRQTWIALPTAGAA